jgi:hypothetical protein
MLNLLEKLIIGFVITVPIFWFIYFSSNSMIYGTDSFYWLLFGFKQPIISNLAMVMMWYSIFFLFYFAKSDYILDANRNPYLIASFFLLNFFSLRFLEVEMDDFLVYLFSFLAIAWLKNNFPYKKYHIFLAIGIVLLYTLEHFGAIFQFSVFLENMRNPLVVYLLLPALYLFIRNRKWKELAFTILFMLVAMTGKLVSNILPVFIFAVYLDFLTDKKFEYSQRVMRIMLILFVVAFTLIPSLTVFNNNQAFKDYCNSTTMICNNTNVSSWHYGHYFAWKGYISDNPSNYGFRCCVGSGCLNSTLTEYPLSPFQK